jgi:mannose-6-phosphate isomerase-like protein (cupin superfamily)
MTRSWLALLALAAGACGDQSTPRAAAATPAQSTPTASGGVELYPAAQLARIADELAKGSTTARTIGQHPAYHYVQARRAASGEPEVHDRWVDVTVVQAGRATLLTGGRVDGAHLASAGEHRGGTIVGGTPRPIATGDLVVIPAGVPHQYQLARGDTVRYLTLKVLQSSDGH